MHKQNQKFVGMKLVHVKINRSTSAITVLLYTYYFSFSTRYMMLSSILHKKAPFRHGIPLPMFFLFGATAPVLDNAAEKTMQLHKHRAHAPLVLAEKLGRAPNAIGERSIKKCIAPPLKCYSIARFFSLQK